MPPILIPTVKLNTGAAIPRLALGTWEIPAAQAPELVSFGLKSGYRSADTAWAYHNEAAVAEGIRQSGLPREAVFLTTKVWIKYQGYKETLAVFRESLQAMQLDYVDLLLIHWPAPGMNKYVDTYKALETLYHEGMARAIGVANFNIDHLETLLARTEVVPATNQFEMHPMLIQPDLLDFCRAHGILPEAYSPLMHGGAILKDPDIAAIALRHGKTNAQVALRYLLQLGVRVLVKSLHKERILENAQVFDFNLTDADMAEIGQMNKGIRTCADPATFPD
ncbi:MAG: aldo/keto reductase [Oscillospiraceae bacterium]|nr:aldo/keto reductase [Oscillospiraceae bacterium]